MNALPAEVRVSPTGLWSFSRNVLRAASVPSVLAVLWAEIFAHRIISPQMDVGQLSRSLLGMSLGWAVLACLAGWLAVRGRAGALGAVCAGAIVYVVSAVLWPLISTAVLLAVGHPWVPGLGSAAWWAGVGRHTIDFMLAGGLGGALGLIRRRQRSQS